jgi:hypothetical protein
MSDTETMSGSKRSSVVLGALTVLCGAPALLGGLGVLPMGPSDPTVPTLQQQALSALFGLVILSGGAWVMLSNVSGPVARVARGGLGFIVAVGLTLVLGWVAIGPGARNFDSPAALFGSRFAEVSGRLGFGVVALLGLLIVVLMIRGVKPKLAGRRGNRPSAARGRGQ